MSTATNLKRRFSSLSARRPTQPHPRRRRRWPWLLAILVLVLLWLLPMLVAHSPLLAWIVDKSAANLNGKISIQGVSLGWFSPIRLSDVAVRDPQGQAILEVSQAQSSRTLLGHLCSWSNLGRLRIERPNLVLVLRPDGSNLEDLIARLPKPKSLAIDLGLDITDGTITVLDTATQRQWQLKALQVAMTRPADQQKPLSLTTSGTWDGAGRVGHFEAELAMRQTGAAAPASNTLKLKAAGLPLDMFQSPLGRLLSSPIRLAGQLASNAEGTWDSSDKGLSFQFAGNLAADQLRLSGSVLGSDELRLSRLDASGQADCHEGHLDLRQLSLRTDIGKIQAEGSLALGNSTASLLASLPQQACHLEGELDIARLAAMLPSTLHLEQNTRITSGALQINLDSRRGPQGMLWRGQVASSRLQATSQGRSIVWEKPIQISFAAHQTDQGPVVENLACESSFLKASGAGTPAQLTASATLNLDQLVDELRGLVDLRQLRLSGIGSTQLSWKRAPDSTFRLDGQLQLRNFECSLPQRPAWAEESVNGWLIATGKTNFTPDTRLDTALVRLETTQDRIEAQLVQPMASLRDGGVWPVQIQAMGRLERWRPRLIPWVNLNDYQFAGSHQLAIHLTASASQLQVHRAQIALQSVSVSGPSVRVDEPRMDLVAAGNWNWAQGHVELPQVTFTSQSLAAQLKQGYLATANQGVSQMRGALHFQGDLSRIQQWVAAAAAEPMAWQVAGQLSGDLGFEQLQDKTAGKLEVVLQRVVAAHRSGRTIQQQAIRLAARGDYQPARGTIHLDEADLNSPMARLTVGGDVSVAQEHRRLDLEGQVQYDWAPIAELLQTTMGTSIRIAGRGANPVAYHGPLSLATAEGKASLAWTSAELYGFKVGRGMVDATLAGGAVSFRPMDLDVNEGKVHLAPRIQLTPQATVLSVDKGRLADQVRINPTVCVSALKYIAPAMSGVASAEGRFSIELDQLQIPLETPERGQLSGRMLIHSVQIGPGTLTQEMALALGYTGAAQIARESTIDFQMTNGRIYHRGVALQFPNTTVRTEGSVGLDKSLSLMAEMPIPPKWQAAKVVGTVLRDQTIRLPINGTVDKPKVDGQALAKLTHQFIENATQNVLQDRLNKQLNKLIPPAPQR